MLIAMPVVSGSYPTEINSHLGRAPFFLLYNTADHSSTFVASQTRHGEENHSHGQGHASMMASQFLMNHSIDALITMGAGMKAIEKFNEANIKVYQAIGSNIEENLHLYDRNGLNLLKEGCSGHHHNHS